jgi:hypothetical protein
VKNWSDLEVGCVAFARSTTGLMRFMLFQH